MATYKLIQDIEAEDHILGPLTLRQFIYALVATLFFYLSFIVLTKNVAFLLILFLPPGGFCAFLAFPFKRDQPTEVWALAKVRYLIKPRKRIWSQSGIKELVTITVPKRTEINLTNGLSKSEALDRLQALALTIDTRGWSVKNMNTIPDPLTNPQENDRLIEPNAIPKPVPDYETLPEEDMLDELNNPTAIKVKNMVNESAQQQRQALIDSLDSIREKERQTQETPGWFDQNENELSSRLKKINSSSGLATANLHTLQSNTQKVLQPNTKPITQQLTPQLPESNEPLPLRNEESQTPKTKTATTNPDIINLSRRDDLNIATLAHQAEVVINLH